MGYVSQRAKRLEPGYFALVMATGIVAIACHAWQWHAIANFLGIANLLAYLWLWLLTLLRLANFSSHLWRDLASHAKGPGFFTLVAGSGVLGSQVGILWDAWAWSQALWLLALALWLLLCCSFFPLVAVKEQGSSGAGEINGLWLVIIVATQSLSVLATALASEAELLAPPEWRMVAVGFHLLGGMLFLLIMPTLFQQFFFQPRSLGRIDPAYWISMGVEAISALAGAQLVIHAGEGGLLADMVPVLTLVTLAYWALASWWLPILLVLGFWRHVLARLPIRYQPGYWGMVFPLGMYCVATFFVATAFGLEWLFPVSALMLPVALLAWGATAFGLAQAIITGRRRAA